jgi:hypothetical protein
LASRESGFFSSVVAQKSLANYDRGRRKDNTTPRVIVINLAVE